ncbi:MAG: pyridoxamine 5'-phosphate oxidase [Actinobacteria bacterium]|nr:pyridoxamine 5'-phosphate oxidase [Actinomycetota bacterium]
MTDDFERLSRKIASLHGQNFESHLTPEDLDPDPFVTFAGWLETALAERPELPNVMTLATATPDGVPSARTVLLKGFDGAGFVFFTNYESRKGRELSANPHAALVFHWPKLHRQVTIAGEVRRVAPEESDEYFATRPLQSKLGTWASRQSSTLKDRGELETRMRVAEEEFPDGNVPRPPYWGGFRLTPERIEFWQGRTNRLHDRFRYQRSGDGWTIERLAP